MSNMLLALLFILISSFFGIGAMLKIKFAEDFLSKLVFGIPTGITASSFILLILYAINGSFTNTLFYAAIGLLAIISVLLFYPSKIKDVHLLNKGKGSQDTENYKKIIIWSLVVYIIIAAVFISSLYMSNGTLYCIGPAICSDLMYHIGIGNSLIYTHFPPKYLFTLDAKNVFPFIADFYSSVLMKYGLGLRWSILLPDLMLFFSAVFGSAFLTYKITKNVFMTIAALFIFWFGSDYLMAIFLYSLSSITSIIPNVLPPLNSLLQWYGLNQSSGPYAILSVAQLIVGGWTSIIYQMLMPQRDFVLGLPIGIMIIYAIYELAFEKVKFEKVDLIYIGLMAGTLPLVHPVTLEVIALVGLFAFFYMLRDKKLRGRAVYEFLAITIPLICIAIPQFVYMTSQNLAAGWYRFTYQYFIPPTGNIFLSAAFGIINIITYWIEMVGIPLILAIIGLKLAPGKVRTFFIPFLLLWIFITVYSVQPNPMDSNKIFLYIFLILSILASYPISWLYKKRRIILKVAAIALIASVSLNFAFIYNYWLRSPLPWITNAEFNAVRFILNNTNESSIFAVSNNDSLLQSVSTLAHRQTLISVEPYVEIDEYTYPLSTLNYINFQIFENGNCSILKEYNISYIFYQESNASGESVFENSNFIKLFSINDTQRDRVIAIYKVVC